MKRAVLYVLVGLAALAALAALVPVLLPTSIYKDRIEAGITRATGRSFTIAGPLHLTVFPALAIRADRVSLANDPGGHAPNFAIADDIRLGVKLWPLLSGRLELTRITLDKPEIFLESETDGRANWMFEHGPRPSRQGRGGVTFTTQVGTIEIIEGRIHYTNFRTSSMRAVDDVHATVQIGQSGRRLHAEGTFVHNDLRMAFKCDAAMFSANTQFVQANLSLSSDLFGVKFHGALSREGSAHGDIALQTKNARDLGTWLGARMPNINGLGVLSLTGHIETGEQEVSLHTLTANLDGMSVGGDLSIDTRGRPRVEGALRVDHLNMNPYIEHPHKRNSHHIHSPEDKWSTDQIALDALRAMDARLRISAGGISLRNLEFGRTDIHVDLVDSDLKASLAPMALYGGTGNAWLHVNAKPAVPTFQNMLEVKGVTLRPFLSDAIGVKHIEGVGTIHLDIVSTGANANAIMHGITGHGAIVFCNGRMRGVDLGAIARSIQTLLGTAIGSDAVTAYTAMGGSFTANRGVLTIRDFQFAGPMLTAKGAGTIDVGDRTMDFRIVPQAAAVIAKQKLTIGLPFRITGAWKHLRYRPDFSSLVKGVIDNIESDRAPFKGLFGPSRPRDANTPKKKHKSIEDALKNMLGIHRGDP